MKALSSYKKKQIIYFINYLFYIYINYIMGNGLNIFNDTNVEIIPILNIIGPVAWVPIPAGQVAAATNCGGTPAGRVWFTLSIEEVIKNHIFNIQDFSENKKLLWLQIKNFLDFKNSIFNLKNISKVKQSKDIISFLIKRPFFTINQINNLLLKKTKDCLLYIFYKLKFLIFFS